MTARGHGSQPRRRPRLQLFEARAVPAPVPSPLAHTRIAPEQGANVARFDAADSAVHSLEFSAAMTCTDPATAAVQARTRRTWSPACAAASGDCAG